MIHTYGILKKSDHWGRMDTCVCVAEALCCSPETITALLIGYINTKKLGKK